MKTAVFYYDDFAEFEIVLTLLLLHKEAEIFSVALEDRKYRSEEHQWFYVDKPVSETDPSEIDLLLIPGGDSRPLHKNDELKKFIQGVVDSGGKIAAICGGSELLAAQGFLDGVRCTGDTSGVTEELDSYELYLSTKLMEDQVVVDGQFITGQGQAYAEFASVVAREMNVLKDSDEEKETLDWLKNIR